MQNPPQPEIKGFIFDIGQVLIKWHFSTVWRKIIAGEPELQRQIDFFRPFLYLGDAGVSYPQIVAVLSAVMPEQAQRLQFWWQHWSDAFEGQIEGTAEIVRQLKAKGYPLYILSNFSCETLPLVEQQIPSLALFDGRIISGAEGLVKPQPEIFRLCIERFGLDKVGRQHFLFVDDLAQNIAAAQQEGLQGHLFTQPEALRAELVQRGILEPLEPAP